MTVSLWLACDTSGSMAEGGKRFIVRGLIRQIEQYFRFGYASDVDLRLAAWSDDVHPCGWNPDDEVPEVILDCRGTASSDALAAFVESHHGDSFLVLTDGFWSLDDRTAIARVRSAIEPHVLRFLKVGLDANPGLRGDDVFETEGSLALFEGWPGR